jgi:hypothetical protein
MERQGYLEQIPDSTDTRAKVVRMTKRGEAVKNACVEVREGVKPEGSKSSGKEGGWAFGSESECRRGFV